MKRFLSVVCCLSMLICMFVMPASAEEVETAVGGVLVSRSVEVLPDGSSVETLIYENPVNSRATTYSKSGTKYYNSRNSAGEILWTFKVTGVFKIVEGSTVYCTSASHSYTIADDAWNYVSGSSYKSGNKAIGNAEFNRKVLGIVIDTGTCTVTLTCDANGNLS